MANANTIACFSNAYPSGHPFALPAAFTTTSATETAFLLVNGGQAQAVIQIPQGTEILGAQTPFSVNSNAAIIGEDTSVSGGFPGENRPFFNSGSFNGRGFRLRAFGTIAGGGTTITSIAGTISLYAALTQLTTVTSGTKIATIASGAILGNVKANWLLDVALLWDNTSQTLNTKYEARINAVTTATTAAALTSVTIANLNFGLTWTFATTSTSNSVGLVELCLERA